MSSWGSRNRGVGRDGNRALTSGRIGSGGRTFHCKLTPLRGSGRGRIAYIHGLDQAREDIILTDGMAPEDIERMMLFADFAEADEQNRRGLRLPMASAFTNIVELPREAGKLSKEGLKAMCNGIVDELHRAMPEGHRPRSTWAIHLAGADNWHLHIVGAASSSRDDPRFIPGSEAMMNWRCAVADRINRSCGTQWHGGTLADTGIDRPAKKRLPMALYKAREDAAAMAPPRSFQEAQQQRKRKDLGTAAKRVQQHLDDLAKVEWLAAKKRREEEAEAAKAATLRDSGTEAVPPEIHQELDRRGLTTVRRARAAEERAREEGRREGFLEAQKLLQRPPKDREGWER